MSGASREPAGKALVVALLIAVALGVTAFFLMVTRAENPILPTGDAAVWVRLDEPFGLAAKPVGPDTVHFRGSILATREQLAGDAEPELRVRSFRSHRVTVNGEPVEEPPAEEISWRTPQRVSLAGRLRPGLNEVRVAVENDRGPPALWAEAAGLQADTRLEWRASRDGLRWNPTVPLTENRRPELALEFPTSRDALARTWPVLLALFALGAAASLLLERPGIRSLGAARFLTVAHARWVLLGLWTLLCLNNLTRIHLKVGFDARHHYQYIIHLVTEGTLPLATEGWQAFQPPFFYLVAALPFAVLAKWFSLEAGQLAVRALSMACGLGMIELSYRTARAVFPGREPVQLLATVVGGFLPMNVYMCHYASNEPMAALLSAAVLALGFRVLMDESGEPLARSGFRLGLLLGLAILTKVSTALLGPPLIALLVWSAARSSGTWRAALAPAGRLALAAGGVSGWYFARNWLELGSPYVGGWDPARGFAWWQYPGYRLPQDFLSFGESLARPVLASFASVWDGLYSTIWMDGFLSSMVVRHVAPPWSYDYAIALVLVSVPMAAAGALGGLRACWRPRTRTQWAVAFAAAYLAVYVLAIVALFASLPVYSTTKGTYMLGLAPCFGLLIAWGFDALPHGRIPRAILCGYVAAWLGFVLLAYNT